MQNSLKQNRPFSRLPFTKLHKRSAESNGLYTGTRPEETFWYCSFKKNLVALCIVLSTFEVCADTITVNSDSQLKQATIFANPGDTILIEPGSYYGGYTLYGGSAAENPVTVKESNHGTVYFKGHFSIQGTGMVLDGINFRQAAKLIIDNADSIRITNCHFHKLTTGMWLQIKDGARNVTVDHNSFTNKNTRGQLLQIRPSPSGNMNHVIRKNYFAHIAPGDRNQFETIQIGQNGVTDRYIETNVLIEQNLLEHADGESEAISVKTSNNIVQYNTFRESKGSLVFRHGHSNRAEGNIFLGKGISSTGGIRFQGSNNVITNNYFQEIKGNGGRAPITIMDGTNPDCFTGGPSSDCHCDHEDVTCYSAVDGALVAFNSFINSSALRFGHNHSNNSNRIPPKNVVFSNNLFYRTTEPNPFIEIPNTSGDGGADELINPSFQGNIFYETDTLCTGSNIDCNKTNVGFEEIAPQLIQVVTNLYGPGQYSPLIDAAVGPGPTVDVVGRQRIGSADIGAVEGVVSSALYPPLTIEDVGPLAPSQSPWDQPWMVAAVSGSLL